MQSTRRKVIQAIRKVLDIAGIEVEELALGEDIAIQLADAAIEAAKPNRSEAQKEMDVWVAVLAALTNTDPALRGGFLRTAAQSFMRSKEGYDPQFFMPGGPFVEWWKADKAWITQKDPRAQVPKITLEAVLACALQAKTWALKNYRGQRGLCQCGAGSAPNYEHEHDCPVYTAYIAQQKQEAARWQTSKYADIIQH